MSEVDAGSNRRAVARQDSVGYRYNGELDEQLSQAKKVPTATKSHRGHFTRI